MPTLLLQHIEWPDNGTGTVAEMNGGYGHALLGFLREDPKMNRIIYKLLTVAQLVDKGFKSPDPPGDSIYSFKNSADVKKRVSVEARSYTASTRTHLEHFVCMYSFQMGIPQQVCTVQADFSQLCDMLGTYTSYSKRGGISGYRMVC